MKIEEATESMNKTSLKFTYFLRTISKHSEMLRKSKHEETVWVNCIKSQAVKN